MKKFSIVALSVLVISLVTGCGTKTLTCTKTEDLGGLKSDQKVVIKFKNDKVKTMDLTVAMSVEEEDVKDNWDLFVSMLDSSFPSEEKEGVKLTTENDKDKYKYTVSINIDLDKASSDVLDEYDLDDIVNSTNKLEDVKKNAEKDGYKCE